VPDDSGAACGTRRMAGDADGTFINDITTMTSRQ
jgi:hypothetical protein